MRDTWHLSEDVNPHLYRFAAQALASAKVIHHVHLEGQNQSFWRRSSQPISWLSTEELKQTQHASVTKYDTT